MRLDNRPAVLLGLRRCLLPGLRVLERGHAHLGHARPPTGSSPLAWHCWRPSRPGKAGRPTRCYRRVWCWTDNRAGAYASMFIAGAGMFGTFLFLTYYPAADTRVLATGDRRRVPAVQHRLRGRRQPVHHHADAPIRAPARPGRVRATRRRGARWSGWPNSARIPGTPAGVPWPPRRGRHQPRHGHLDIDQHRDVSVWPPQDARRRLRHRHRRPSSSAPRSATSLVNTIFAGALASYVRDAHHSSPDRVGGPHTDTTRRSGG